MNVVVATTLSAWGMSEEDYWRPWIENAIELSEETWRSGNGHRVEFFAALQTNGTGLEPFTDLITDLIAIDGSYMSFEAPLDTMIAPDAVGLNIATDYACQVKADWLLTTGSSRELKPNAVDLLIDVNHPLVGGATERPGPEVPGFEIPVEATTPDAWFCLTHRDLFRHMRWREEREEGGGRTLSDCWTYDALHYLGIEGYVRQDVTAEDRVAS